MLYVISIDIDNHISYAAIVEPMEIIPTKNTTEKFIRKILLRLKLLVSTQIIARLNKVISFINRVSSFSMGWKDEKKNTIKHMKKPDSKYL